MSGEQTRTEATTSSVTTTIVVDSREAEPLPTLKLRCHKPKTDKKVKFTETTVDNEHLNRKKSKCCCVYVKPKAFGESSSEEDSDCEHCSGHVEMKKKQQQHTETMQSSSSGGSTTS